ncbi:hypothetical protein ACFXTH_000248 [Malus domestica]
MRRLVGLSSVETKAHAIEAQTFKKKNTGGITKNVIFLGSTCKSLKNQCIKGFCWVFGKPGHKAEVCCHKNIQNVAANSNNNNNQANMVEDTLVAVVFEINSVANVEEWWIDIEATKYVCGDINLFTTYQ